MRPVLALSETINAQLKIVSRSVRSVLRLC
jgi:hypothetical protein